MERPKNKKLKVDDDAVNPFIYEEGVTDIVLQVRDMEIHVNKGVLMTCSQVFKDMLLMCKDDNRPIAVDEDPKSFLRFFKFIYPSVLQEAASVESLNDILRLADKYGICTPLLKRCDLWFEEYLRTSFLKMKESDRIACIEVANKYDLKKTMATGLKIMEVYDYASVHKSKLSDHVKLAIASNRLLQFEKLFKDTSCCTEIDCCMDKTRDKIYNRKKDVFK